MSRAFLDTNGVRGLQDVLVKEGLTTTNPFHSKITSIKENLKQPNVASQIGLGKCLMHLLENQQY